MIYLRGVELLNIVEKYKQGKYTSVDVLPLSNEQKRQIRAKKSVVSDNKMAVVDNEFVNEHGTKYLILTHGNPPYNCMYCLHPIKDNNGIGIPVSKVEKNGQCTYEMVDIFHPFGCVLAELRQRLWYATVRYDYSIQYLAEIYESETGQAFTDLKEAPDKYLLQLFNGPMQWDQWISQCGYYPSKFVRTLTTPLNKLVEK